MKISFLLTIGILISFNLTATPVYDSLPYREIPDYPNSYTPETVAARMIDGLGFRYYWATEGLRSKDLAFKPMPDARTTEETIDHILSLTNMITQAVDKNNVAPKDIAQLNFEAKRKKTLENLKKVSDLLKSGTIQLENCFITLNRGDKKTTLPFWNQINGPIEDAVWHVGQVVSFRRSSGNPFNGKASVLTGKVSQ